MISPALEEYVKKFIGKKDDSGMTAGLYIVFDDLHLGATPSTLMDIAALCVLFTTLQGKNPEELLKEKLTHLEGCATHSLPIHGVTNLNKVMAFGDKTLVMTVKHTVEADEEPVQIVDRKEASEFEDANERVHNFEGQEVVSA